MGDARATLVYYNPPQCPPDGTRPNDRTEVEQVYIREAGNRCAP
jgi:hypothetical protein